jgi:hypothetical protein
MAPGCAGASKHPSTSWMGFHAGRWPGADWRPYGDDSPFNVPIPRGARIHPRSRAIVARILSWGTPAPMVAGTSDSGDDYGHPTYYARSTDPVYRLRPTMGWGRSSIRGKRIHIPAHARPAGGSDGHMTVVQPNGWEYDFWRTDAVPPFGGTLRFGWGGRLRIDGSGLGGKATASGFGNLAGIVRAPELAAGRIDHALFLVVRCTSEDGAFHFGARRPRDRTQSAFVYPATHGGSRCRSDERDAPPMGARLQLAMSDEQIDALALPTWKAGILRALAHYGGYIGDTGGPGFAVQLESSSTYTAFGAADPLLGIAAQSGDETDAGVQEYAGRYSFDVASGVDWASRLRVVTPPQR